MTPVSWPARIISYSNSCASYNCLKEQKCLVVYLSESEVSFFLSIKLEFVNKLMKDHFGLKCASDVPVAGCM